MATSDGSLNTDIIRSLLSELVDKFKESNRNDKGSQKQTEQIISALRELNTNVKDSKLDTEQLVNELSDKIAKKLNPIIKEASNEEIKALHDINEEQKQAERLNKAAKNGNPSNTQQGQRNINPNATEEEANNVNGNGGNGGGGNNAAGAASPGRGGSKWGKAAFVAAEAAVVAGGMLTTEIKKGLDSSFKAFNTLSEAGNTFNGSVMEMRKAAYDSGMTLEQFTKDLSDSNSSFKVLGTETIVRFNKAISQVTEANLGLAITTDQRINYEQDYINILQAQGQSARQSTQDTSDGFLELIKQSRQLSNVFGDSASSIAKATADYLNSKEGFLNVSSLVQNQQNAAEFNSVGRNLGRYYQLDDKTIQAIMSYSATGYASQDLRRFQGQGGTGLVEAIAETLRPIARSMGRFDSSRLGDLIANTNSQIARQTSSFDRINSQGRAAQLDNMNDTYATGMTVSNAARLARSRNSSDIISAFNNINTTGTEMTQSVTQAYQNTNINAPMAQEAVQNASMQGLEHTIHSFEDIYKSQTQDLAKRMMDLSDSIKNQTSMTGKMISQMDKTVSSVVGKTGNNSFVRGISEVAMVAGPIIAPIVGAYLGSKVMGRILQSTLTNMHLEGGGRSGILNTLRGEARNAARAAEKGASKSAGRAGANIVERTGLRTLGKFALEKLPLVGTGLGFGLQGYDLYKDHVSGNRDAEERDVKGIKTTMGTTLTGAAIGAGIGAQFLGVGAIPGAIIGAGIGYTVGDIGNMFFNSEKEKDDKNTKILDNIKNKQDLTSHKINNIDKNSTIEHNQTETNTSPEEKTQQNTATTNEKLEELIGLFHNLIDSNNGIHQETTTQNNLLFDRLNNKNNYPSIIRTTNQIN